MTGAAAGKGGAGAAEPGAGGPGRQMTIADPEARVVTIPNALSLARLAGVPVFLWLVVGVRSQAGDWWAVGLLIAAAASDWLDGKIAPALNQQSRLREMPHSAAGPPFIWFTIVSLSHPALLP